METVELCGHIKMLKLPVCCGTMCGLWSPKSDILFSFWMWFFPEISHFLWIFQIIASQTSQLSWVKSDFFLKSIMFQLDVCQWGSEEKTCSNLANGIVTQFNRQSHWSFYYEKIDNAFFKCNYCLGSNIQSFLGISKN